MSEWSALGYAITELGSAKVLDVATRETGISAGGDKAPKLSATAGGIRGKEDGACAECIPSSPRIDRHGDNRFADNILRALEGLPQNGDDEEERDAAEEGALIEASPYQFPEYERNGR